MLSLSIIFHSAPWRKSNPRTLISKVKFATFIRLWRNGWCVVCRFSARFVSVLCVGVLLGSVLSVAAVGTDGGTCRLSERRCRGDAAG